MYLFCIFLIILMIIMVIYGKGCRTNEIVMLSSRCLISSYRVVEINSVSQRLELLTTLVRIRSPTYLPRCTCIR